MTPEIDEPGIRDALADELREHWRKVLKVKGETPPPDLEQEISRHVSEALAGGLEATHVRKLKNDAAIEKATTLAAERLSGGAVAHRLEFRDKSFCLRDTHTTVTAARAWVDNDPVILRLASLGGFANAERVYSEALLGQNSRPLIVAAVGAVGSAANITAARASWLIAAPGSSFTFHGGKAASEVYGSGDAGLRELRIRYGFPDAPSDSLIEYDPPGGYEQWDQKSEAEKTAYWDSRELEIISRKSYLNFAHQIGRFAAIRAAEGTPHRNAFWAIRAFSLLDIFAQPVRDRMWGAIEHAEQSSEIPPAGHTTLGSTLRKEQNRAGSLPDFDQDEELASVAWRFWRGFAPQLAGKDDVSLTPTAAFRLGFVDEISN